MMDCLGLLGEKPIMPAPPKVWPLKPVVEPVVEVFALAAFGSVGGVPSVGVGASVLGFGPVGAQFELLLVEGLGVPAPDKVLGGRTSA